MDMPRGEHSHHHHGHHGQAVHGGATAHPASAAKPGAVYTCPMHPEIRSPNPGTVPSAAWLWCLLPERSRMTRSSVISPAAFGSVSHYQSRWCAGDVADDRHPRSVRPAAAATRLDRVCAGTPVVLWVGWPILRKFWFSLVHRALNMYTLIGLGWG